ncbi:MAG: hypothetical protein HOG51_15410 [Gammaproteobacteria bacterium]|nr:hypothetical protein [Gammaproteobacteria bacterium]
MATTATDTAATVIATIPEIILVEPTPTTTVDRVEETVAMSIPPMAMAATTRLTDRGTEIAISTLETFWAV